jgi:hypothetical protein
LTDPKTSERLKHLFLLIVQRGQAKNKFALQKVFTLSLPQPNKKTMHVQKSYYFFYPFYPETNKRIQAKK